uniref:Uncharacterized protein n=1 Tax=Vespula pensylvanica TaxID=30213 RepID=A0A834NLV5_VESPE|nr:hypothetical protein H0235_012789 [Vespula pensylvanica]
MGIRSFTKKGYATIPPPLPLPPSPLLPLPASTPSPPPHHHHHHHHHHPRLRRPHRRTMENSPFPAGALLSIGCTQCIKPVGSPSFFLFEVAGQVSVSELSSLG